MPSLLARFSIPFAALIMPLFGQSPTSSWVATTVMTAATSGQVSQTNTLPIGTNLAAGQVVQAFGSTFSPPPFGSGQTTVQVSSTFSAANIAGGQTFQIAQNLVVIGSSFGPLGSTDGTSTITLASTDAIWARLTVTYTGTGPFGTASIDVGADGAVDWTSTQSATWQVLVPIQGTVDVRVSASLPSSFFSLNRNLLLRFDYYSARVGAGSPIATGIPIIAPAGGASAIGNAGFGISGTGFLPNGLAILVLKAGALPPLPGLQIPGAQPGCALHLGLPYDLLAGAIAGPSGDSIYPLPIPNDGALVGLDLGAQWFGWDPSLAFPLPLGSTPALSVRVVN